MQFDWTVNFGSILAIVGIIAVGFKTWSKFESMLTALQQNQQAMSQRMSTHEESDRQMFNSMQLRLTDLVGSVQRLIGQNDAIEGRERKRDRLQ